MQNVAKYFTVGAPSSLLFNAYRDFSPWG